MFTVAVILKESISLQQKSLKYFSILPPLKNDVRFEYVPQNFSFHPDFVSFLLFDLTLVIKLTNFGFKSRLNNLIFKKKKRIRHLDLNLAHRKVSDFVSFPFFGFT